MEMCVGKTVSSYSYTHLKNSQLISKYRKNSLHSPSLHSHIIKPPCVVRLRTIYYNSGQLIFIGILIAFCIANILSFISARRCVSPFSLIIFVYSYFCGTWPSVSTTDPVFIQEVFITCFRQFPDRCVCTMWMYNYTRPLQHFGL